jgi:hypothetical protein
MRPEEFVRRYRLDHLVCSFSRGRDSLVATHLTMEALRGADVGKHVVWMMGTRLVFPWRRPPGGRSTPISGFWGGDRLKYYRPIEMIGCRT